MLQTPVRFLVGHAAITDSGTIGIFTADTNDIEKTISAEDSGINALDLIGMGRAADERKCSGDGINLIRHGEHDLSGTYTPPLYQRGRGKSTKEGQGMRIEIELDEREAARLICELLTMGKTMGDGAIQRAKHELEEEALKAEAEKRMKEYQARQEQPMEAITLFTAYNEEDGEEIYAEYNLELVKAAAKLYEETQVGRKLKLRAETLYEDGTEIVEYSDGTVAKSQAHGRQFEAAKAIHPEGIKRITKDHRFF